MEVRAASPDHPAPADFVVFDYPGDYCNRDEGEAYARVRLEEFETRRERATCRSTARGLFAGGHFELEDHPREDQNREYLVVKAAHEIWSDLHETGKEQDRHEVYTSALTLMGSQKTYRPPRITPRPVVSGPQTAVVVGPPSVKRIYTDPEGYGRVKVRFHWDHRNSGQDGSPILDEQRSCWIRVTQRSAGKGWGAMQLPHVGNEVVVEFLEGDPDRPIITGCVYNLSNRPPLGRLKARIAENVSNIER
jgi:type VI secretion system secreted protein VgrG